MKYLIMISVLFIAGCTDSSKAMLNAEITGENYTIFVPELNYYEVNEYDIIDGVIYFTANGGEYQSNVWTVKTTKR